jgi:hypothetical protein
LEGVDSPSSPERDKVISLDRRFRVKEPQIQQTSTRRGSRHRERKNDRLSPRPTKVHSISQQSSHTKLHDLDQNSIHSRRNHIKVTSAAQLYRITKHMTLIAGLTLCQKYRVYKSEAPVLLSSNCGRGRGKINEYCCLNYLLVFECIQ